MKKFAVTGLALLGLAVILIGVWYFIPAATKQSLGNIIPVDITLRATATPATDGSAPVYNAVDALKDAEANQADAAQELQNMENAATQAANNLNGSQATATEAAHAVETAKANVANAGNNLIGAPTPIATQTPLPTIGPRP